MSQGETDQETERWRLEKTWALAERYHEDNKNFANSTNEAAIQAGSAALKALILINGGAAVATLAFVGSLVGEVQHGDQVVLRELTMPLIWFGVGVAVAALGTLLAYITNFSYASSVASREPTYEQPFIKDTKASIRWARAGTFAHVLALASAVSSLIVFLVGMASVRAAILATPIG